MNPRDWRKAFDPFSYSPDVRARMDYMTNRFTYSDDNQE